MECKLKSRIILAVFLSLLLFTVFSAKADERKKRFEVLFSGGASYATSRLGFSPGVGFSYYITNNMALSFDFGVAYRIPELDFRQYWIPKLEAAITHITATVDSQYRLLSSLSVEYDFAFLSRVEPFITTGIGWCWDRVDIELFHLYFLDSQLVAPKAYLENIKYRDSGSYLFLIGGGIRYPVRDNEVLKIMVRTLHPGGEFATYQITIGWGFKF